jgi:hypothetical protein
LISLQTRIIHDGLSACATPPHVNKINKGRTRLLLCHIDYKEFLAFNKNDMNGHPGFLKQTSALLVIGVHISWLSGVPGLVYPVLTQSIDVIVGWTLLCHLEMWAFANCSLKVILSAQANWTILCFLLISI